MLELKRLTMRGIVLLFLLAATAQGSAGQEPAFFGEGIPQGFTLERYTMNADDEAWLSGRAREATGRTCEMYARLVLKYVGDPSGLTIQVDEPVQRIREALGEGVRVAEEAEGGLLFVTSDGTMVADVDYLWTDVSPYGIMVRYELTWCSTTTLVTSP